jgi:hypothetical protein
MASRARPVANQQTGQARRDRSAYIPGHVGEAG